MTSDTPHSEITQTAYNLAEDIQEHLNAAYKLAADVREHIIESAQPDDPLETTDSIMAGVDACENLRRLLAPYVEGPATRETMPVATAVEQLDLRPALPIEADATCPKCSDALALDVFETEHQRWTLYVITCGCGPVLAKAERMTLSAGSTVVTQRRGRRSKTPVATAVEQLNQLTGTDYEADHSKADEILLAVLDGLAPDVSDAYSRLVARATNWSAT